MNKATYVPPSEIHGSIHLELDMRTAGQLLALLGACNGNPGTGVGYGDKHEGLYSLLLEQVPVSQQLELKARSACMADPCFDLIGTYEFVPRNR